MEQEKNNKGLIILVIILCLLVLGMGGYIVYDKKISDKEIPTNETTNNEISNNQSTIINDKETTTNETTNNIVSNNQSSVGNNYNVTNNVSKELYYYKLGDDLNTEFKIYQIGNVYIATSTIQGKQCNTSDTLIFNSEGIKLKEYKYAYVQINNDIININYSTDGVCLSSNENMIGVKYQVVGSNIIEK